MREFKNPGSRLEADTRRLLGDVFKAEARPVLQVDVLVHEHVDEKIVIQGSQVVRV